MGMGPMDGPMGMGGMMPDMMMDDFDGPMHPRMPTPPMDMGRGFGPGGMHPGMMGGPPMMGEEFPGGPRFPPRRGG